jgi:hypothetical protein
MAEQHTLEVGNAIIVLTDIHDAFRDGHTTGYLECDDERHRPCFPFTSHSICKHLLAVVNEPSLPSLWKAGRIAGWMEALMEHSPQTFKSRVAAEQITALHVMEKKRFVRGGNGHLLRPFL